MKTILIICFGFLLASCETKECDTGTVKVTYSVEWLQREGAPKLSPLQLAIFKNKSHERIVYADGWNSCAKEINDDFYFNGIMTTVKHHEDSTAFYSKSFPYVTFWSPIPYLEPKPVNEESFPVEVKFPDEEKIILGYHCKKATIKEEHYSYTIWVTSDFRLTDNTGAVLHKDSIQGAILEMDEYWNSPDIHFYKKYKVKSLQFRNHEPGIFDLPKGAVKMTPDQADSKNWELMLADSAKKEAANPYPESEKQKFEGNWILAVGKDNIKVTVKRKSGNEYELSEKYTINGETQPFDTFPAKFYHDKLLVKHSPNYEIYILTKDGKLKKASDDFLTFSKQ